MKWSLQFALIAATLVASATSIVGWQTWRQDSSNLSRRMAGIVKFTGQTVLNCKDVASAQPLVLLALGQSNAANHGALEAGLGGEITVLAEGRCVRSRDPLPGGTGRGGSIWSRLEPALRARGIDRPLLLSLLAVDASSIREWTHGPLAKQLQSRIEMHSRMGISPALVLWQQGEADALAGTSQREYEQGLEALSTILSRSGSAAPILLAQSTVCRSNPSTTVRAAVAAASSRLPQMLAGPDTDLLTGAAYRFDGCHFGAHGLDRAAQAWADAIVHALHANRRPS